MKLATANGNPALIGEEVSNSAPTPVNPTDIANKQYVDGKKEESIAGTRLDASVDTSYVIDLSSAALFNLTLTAATDFTFANLPTGTNTKRFSVRLTGDFAFTLPAFCKALSGDSYDGTLENRLEFEVINGSSGSEKIEYRIENVPA